MAIKGGRRRRSGGKDLRAKLQESERKELVKLLQERHRMHLKPGEQFTCEGFMTHGEAHITMTLADPEEEAVLTLEGRIDLEAMDIQNPQSGRDYVLDCLDEALHEHFESERMWKPSMVWREHPYDKVMVWMRGSLRNLKVERMADALLGESSEGL